MHDHAPRPSSPDRARTSRTRIRAFRPHAEVLEGRVALSHAADAPRPEVAARGVEAGYAGASGGGVGSLGAAHATAAHAASVVRSRAAAPASARLLSVTFGGRGFHAISSDPDPRSGETTLHAHRQWLGGGPFGSAGRQSPVLYAGGSTLAVSASWALSVRDPRRGVILARGFGPDGIEVGPTHVVRSRGRLAVESARAEAPFAAVPRYDADFVIRWQLSFDGGRSWADAGASENPLYVSSGTPIPDPNSGKLFLTVVDTAVRHAAGVTGQAATIGAIWGEFVGLDASRADGAPLRYYGATPRTENTSVAKLLRDGDGQCSTWAKLFLDMLLVHGIRERGNYVVISAPRSDDFLIKSYAFAGGVASGVSNYPYVNIPEQDIVDAAGHLHPFRGLEEVTRAPNAPDMLRGQNSPAPASRFTNHQIVRLGGTFYDPSYGKTFASLAEYTSESVAGYAKKAAVLNVNAAALGIALGPDVKDPDVRVLGATVFGTNSPAVDSLAIRPREGTFDYGFKLDLHQ